MEARKIAQKAAEYSRLEHRSSVQTDFEAISDDDRFAISLAQKQIESLITFCKKAYPIETGGILVGHYSVDLAHAVVTAVVPPTDDSVGSRYSFRRGVRGLQGLLVRLWAERQYYLGEWHFHPDGSASPSGTDDRQMVEVANSFAYNCPEPILLVVGGNPSIEADLQSFVFVRGTPGRLQLTTRKRGV